MSTPTGSWSSKLFGPTLLNSDGAKKPTESLLEKKSVKYVVIYFSASWCGPCQRFTPMLKSFYEECLVPNKVEVVFVSSDRDEASFNKYFGKMPWTAMPITAEMKIKQNLAETFRVSGIPHLVCLKVNSSPEPLFVSDTLRNDIFEIAGSKVKGEALVGTWNRTDAVPIEKAQFAGDRSFLSKAIWFILKNPMYLFGAYYMIRKFLGYLQELGDEGDSANSIGNNDEI